MLYTIVIYYTFKQNHISNEHFVFTYKFSTNFNLQT